MKAANAAEICLSYGKGSTIQTAERQLISERLPVIVQRFYLTARNLVREQNLELDMDIANLHECTALLVAQAFRTVDYDAGL